MAKNVFLATILVFLIVADVSNASFLSQIRKLVAASLKGDPNGSPIPSPAPTENQSTTVGGEDKGKESKNEPTPSSTDVKSKPKVDKRTPNSSPPPSSDGPKKESETRKEDVKEKVKSKPDKSKESCSGYDLKCRDTKSMIACVKSVDHAAKALVLLIQNVGDSSIKVDMTVPPSLNKKNVADIPKLQTKVLNVALPNGGSNVISLNAGNGDCVIHLSAPASQGNFFQHLPSYSKFMTPVYGAYSLFALVLIAGGVWACCWFGKRKPHSEIPYQELEMSMPESAAAAETPQGWDQVWDDDWDEEKAVTSTGAKNVSANGLTSRTPNKGGWEDWDD